MDEVKHNELVLKIFVNFVHIQNEGIWPKVNKTATKVHYYGQPNITWFKLTFGHMPLTCGYGQC